MDLKEICGLLNEGAKWALLGGAAYAGACFAMAAAPSFYSEQIYSQAGLERITREEAGKLGLKKKIIPKLCDSLEAEAELADGYYSIKIGGFLATRSVVKHELYHIHKGHCEYKQGWQNLFLNRLDYFFRQEPQALLYEVFGLKL